MRDQHALAAIRLIGHVHEARFEQDDFDLVRRKRAKYNAPLDDFVVAAYTRDDEKVLTRQYGRAIAPFPNVKGDEFAAILQMMDETGDELRPILHEGREVAHSDHEQTA